jgi:predicted DNA-binding protein
MRKKTESLTFPADPLAAMRELQELNPAPPAAPSDARPEGQETPNPLHEAILNILAQPYTRSPAQGPFTVTSIKMHTELWERLGLASTLTGRPKQELVAEALRAYLETVRRTYLPEEPPSDSPGDRGDRTVKTR